MKPLRRRFGRQSEGREVFVFPAVRSVVARNAKSAPVHDVLPKARPIAPGIKMVRRDGAICNATILACVAGPALDFVLPCGSCRSNSFGANALFPVRVGGWIDSPVIIAAFTGAILARPATDAIGGHSEYRSAPPANAINLTTDPDVLTRDGTEFPAVGGPTAKRCVTDGALPNGLVRIADAHALPRTELGPALGASLATSSTICFGNLPHGNTATTRRAKGATGADTGRTTDRTCIGVAHAPIIPQTLK